MGKIFWIIVFSLVMITSPEIYGQKKRDGDYYFKVSTFDRAIKEYQREWRRNKNNTDILEKIVISYLNSNVDRLEGLPYIEKLLQTKRNSKTVLQHGKILYYGLMFREAILEFEWVKMHAAEDSEEYIDADKYLKWTLNAQALIESPVNVDFVNAGKGINTNKSELNPFINEDEDILAYSTDKKYNSAVGIYYYNVSVSLKDNYKWEKGKYLTSGVNSFYDEIVAGFSKDGQELFVFNNTKGSESVGYAKYEGGRKFSPLTKFGNPIDGRGGEFGVCLSGSRDTIYFAAENELGKTNIYYSIKLPTGEYGSPREVPGKINTKDNENFATLSKDGKRLYFSSDCENSMGGYDLFYSDYDEKTGTWMYPVNLGYPINDLYDNYTISFTGDKRYAYVSAVREEGYGERDIYKIVFNDKQPTNLILKCKIKMDTDTGTIIPPSELSVLLKNSKGEEIGKYKCTTDSAKFIMAITPGDYSVACISEDVVIWETPLLVDEMYYKNVPIYKEFVIPNENR